MYLVLFGVGLLTMAAGLVTIGFGIPINAFSLGNTLIIAGTVAVMGGFVLIGLAAAVRQLNRIAVALSSRPVARPAVAADASDTVVPPTARIPQAPVRTPPIPVEAVIPRPTVEPRSPAAPSDAPGPLDWLRSKPNASGDAPPTAPEPPVMDVSDEAPLSPRAPQRPMFSPPPFAPPPAAEPPVEPKAWSPGRGGSAPEPMPRMESKPDAQPAPVPRSEQVARVTAPLERAKDMGKETGLFDVVWPDARSKPMPGSEPVQRASRPEPMPPPQRPREESRGEKRAEPSSAERPSAVLKSGVIDGMAYTLYVDGSIEAELPQGTVRFASVDALRAHLEKSV